MSTELPHAAGIAEARASALVLVPLVVGRLRPTSVVDVGCGTGGWLSVLAELGFDDYLGIDAAYVRDALLIEDDHFVAADITQPLASGRTFDLVISVEVAEHIPEEDAATYVASLAALGDLVLFSAATPGQEGPGHVNLQWPRYWTALFAETGLRPSDPFRRDIWEDDRIAFWYRQNLVVYGTEARLREAAFEMEDPLPLLHPRLLDWFPSPLTDRELLASAASVLVRRLRRSPSPRG